MAIVEHEPPAVEIPQQPVLPDPKLTISDYLLLAAEEIEKNGWCTGKETDEIGRHCVSGALQAVGADFDTQRFLSKQVGRDIIHWNDHEVPRKKLFGKSGGAYVAKTLRDAAEAARE